MARQKKLPPNITKRGRMYYSDFRANGERIREPLSTDLNTAKKLLVQLRARHDLAKHGILDNDYPLLKLKEEFLKHCRQTLKPGTVTRYEYCLEQIVPVLPVITVHQLSMDIIRNYRESRLKSEVSPRTINMEVTVLGTLLRWGVSDRKIGSNPLGSVKHLPHDHAKEGRALTDDEVTILLDRSAPLWRDIWYAFLVTGMRKAELASLTFADIDWSQKELFVRRGIAKNHKPRRLPIDSKLGNILQKLEEGRAARKPGKAQRAELNAKIAASFSRDHVFVTTACTPFVKGSRLYHAFMHCCEKADIQTRTHDNEGRVIEHVDLHSLRRTFATNLIINGADPKSVQELLGHQTLRMTMEIYAKIHTQTKRATIGKLSYGSGALAPDHILEYPGTEGNPVQDGHKLATSSKNRKAN